MTAIPNFEHLTISPHYPQEMIDAWGGSEEFNQIPAVKWESIHSPSVAEKFWDGRGVAPLKGKDTSFLLFTAYTPTTHTNYTVLIFSKEGARSLNQWQWRIGHFDWNMFTSNLDDSDCDYLLRLFRHEPCGIKTMNGEESTRILLDGSISTYLWRA